MLLSTRFIQYIFISIILKIYTYRINKQEEKLYELQYELDCERDAYRQLLYDARSLVMKQSNIKIKENR